MCVDIAYNVFEREVLSRAETASTGVRANAAHGQTSIARSPGYLHGRDAGGARCAAPRLRADLRRPRSFTYRPDVPGAVT